MSAISRLYRVIINVYCIEYIVYNVHRLVYYLAEGYEHCSAGIPPYSLSRLTSALFSIPVPSEN